VKNTSGVGGGKEGAPKRGDRFKKRAVWDRSGPSINANKKAKNKKQRRRSSEAWMSTGGRMGERDFYTERGKRKEFETEGVEERAQA